MADSGPREHTALGQGDRATLRRLKEIVRLAPIGVGIVDREGRTVLTNDALSAMLGYTTEEFAELPFKDFTHPDDIARNLELFEELMACQRESFELDKRFIHKDGHIVWGRLFVSLLREAEDGELEGAEDEGCLLLAIGLLQDITEEKRLRDELERLAFHDPLTDLPNRRLLADRLTQHLERGRRTSHFGTVLFADLDDFKPLNDTLGHHAGDVVLCAVAERIVRCVRPADTVCRLGGDEFAVLLEDVTDAAMAFRLAERLHDQVTAPVQVADRSVRPSVSTGVVLLSADHDADRALREADLAMYQAKLTGNRVALYTPDLLEAAMRRFEQTFLSQPR